MSWSLQIANGEPQLFSTYGLSGLKRKIRSQQAGVFTFTADGAACDSNALAAEGTLCTVYNGGTPYFRGRLHQIPRKGSGAAERVDYELLDAWHDFERNVYQQQWNVIISADEEGNPTTAAQYRSECILGMDLNGAALNSGQVIAQIVQWAMAVGAYCQIGVIGVGAPVPFDEVTDLPCSECIRKMLRLTPDAVTWMDYTTAPPTFNVTRRGDCAAVTIPFEGNVEEVGIKALPDLVVPSVVIRYLQENTTDGVPSVDVIPDVWPPGAAGTEYGALVQSTRLAGTSSTYQKNPVVTSPIPQDAGDSNAVAFLQRNTWLGAFSSGRLTVNSLSGIVIPGQYDSSGHLKDSAFGDYPNQVVSGDIAPWMGVHSAYVTVTAQVSYVYPDEPDDESTAALAAFGPEESSLPGWSNDATVTVTVIGTDAVTRTYSQLSGYTQAEPVPTGLAAMLYNSLSGLQYEGTYEIVTQEVSSWRLGTVLNLVGGRAEWATMNALLQEILDDLDQGHTTLKFGPPGHLTLQDLMEQLRANRTRAASSHIKERQSGQPGDPPTVDGPGQGGDTNSAPPPQPTHYPWEDFIDDQDNDDGSPATYDVLLGYGNSSFADTDAIDHSGPIEQFEISVGNDTSDWTGPDHDATDLNNVFSLVSGDEVASTDRLWLGVSDGSTHRGSLFIKPIDPSIYLSTNLNPEDDSDDDPHIRISLGEQVIELLADDGNVITLGIDPSSGAVTGNFSDGGGNYVLISVLDGAPYVEISGHTGDEFEEYGVAVATLSAGGLEVRGTGSGYATSVLYQDALLITQGSSEILLDIGEVSGSASFQTVLFMGSDGVTVYSMTCLCTQPVPE